MKMKEWEFRVMEYFAENMNLYQCMEIARQCAKEILDLKFNEIAFGNYEMPTAKELKETVASRIPYEFNPDDFVEKGPLDFSDQDECTVTETLGKIELLYKKFHDAQARVVAKAARSNIESWAENIKEEIHALKNKYLS